MTKLFVVLLGLAALVMVTVSTGCAQEDNQPPEISIDVRATGNYRSEFGGDSIKGIVEVVATATDNVGIDEVIFLVNGRYDWQPMKPKTDSAGNVISDEFVYMWDTKLLGDSVYYSISAAAFDESGNSDTTQEWTFLIRIPNEPPLPVWDSSRSPRNNVTVRDSAGLPWLEWQGSDPDTLPRQIPIYNVYFGTSENNLELVADSVPHQRNDSDTTRTRWSALNLGYILPPESDYYWMIETIDPYGQKTPSSVFKFRRGENSRPLSTETGDSNMILSYPSDGKLRLTWTSNYPDQDGDSVTWRVFFGEAENNRDWDNVIRIASGLELPSITVDVEPDKVYYWKSVATDMWGATRDSATITIDTTDTGVIYDTIMTMLWRIEIQD